ncbi:hypothetical protein UNDYM_3732 [Undibacterium sp. YM2]|uniref:hypothetical protein n=1 Tax=Undibacterium sp. YM2 TaxID=2058625 RepID=UPI001331DB09|nr:hypothetical protein [Undibacterium sp. YM2]BBB67985.1 hypothetical protein UNDYM_3732 [Undibacterium sp. YM2]
MADISAADWYKQFGRAGDQAGVDYWSREIAAKGADAAQRAFYQAASDNIISGRGVGNVQDPGSDYVTGTTAADFYTPFGKVGDQAGIDYWNNEIKNKGLENARTAFQVAAAQNMVSGKGIGSGNIQTSANTSTQAKDAASTDTANNSAKSGSANGMPTAEYLAAQNARMAALGNVGGPYQAGEFGMPGASARPDYEQKLAAMRMQSELATAAANRQKQMAAKPFDSVQSSGMYSSDPLIDMQRRIAEAQSMNPAQQEYLRQQMSQLTPQQLQQLGGIDETHQTYTKTYNNGAYNNAQQQLFNQRQAYGMAGFDAPANQPQVPVTQQQQQLPYIQPFQQSNAYNRSVNMNWGNPNQPRAQTYWGNEGQVGNSQNQQGQSNPYIYGEQYNNFQSPFLPYPQNPYGMQSRGAQSNFQQPMGLLNQGFAQQQPANGNQNRYGLLSAYGSR